MEVKDHLPLAELERLERSETSAQCAKRLRIVILAMRGFTAPAMAMCVGLSRRICQRWVRRYNEAGLAGLNDLRGQQWPYGQGNNSVMPGARTIDVFLPALSPSE